VAKLVSAIDEIVEIYRPPWKCYDRGSL